MSNRTAKRRSHLRRLLKRNKLPAMLISHPVNVRYLTGFTGDSTWLLISASKEILISDGRFTTQLEQECLDIPVHIRPITQSLIDAVAEVTNGFGELVCGFEAGAISYEQAASLKENADKVELLPQSGLVESLREIKDADEINAIREAIKQAEKGFELLKASLTGEMTELEASFVLEAGARKFGAYEASFETIVAVGERAALPHARPGATLCNESPFLLVDWGARSTSGYISDLTRMLVTGSISSKLQRVYEVVKTAQQAAISIIKPGIEAKAVDQAARSVIEKAGFGPKFNHGLGHGIGLEVHESLRLGANSEAKLAAGMVLTVEPGIYLPGWGGIRLEDDVLVTKEGHEVLSSLPLDLEAAKLWI